MVKLQSWFTELFQKCIETLSGNTRYFMFNLSWNFTLQKICSNFSLVLLENLLAFVLVDVLK